MASRRSDFGRGLQPLRSGQQLCGCREGRCYCSPRPSSGVFHVREAFLGPSGFRPDLYRNFRCPRWHLLTFIDVPGGVTWAVRCQGQSGVPGVPRGIGDPAPIAGAVGVFLSALVTHLLVLLVVGSGHSGFGSTFRVVSYSSVTSLLGWIPFVGWLFTLYRLYLATVGIREMHSTTTGRALLVVLLPAILILVLVLVLVGASAIVFFRAA